MSNNFQHKIHNFSKEICLSSATEGKRYVIRRCTLTDPTKTRLAELGMVSGTTVAIVKKAPTGSPLQLTVQGYWLCLRTEQAKGFWVREKIE